MEYKIEEIKTMGIKFKKTAIAYELGKIEIKKSGWNKYSEYKYMEMEDFLPHLRELMFKYRIATEFSMDKDNKIGILQLLDCDSEQKLIFTMPYEVPEIKATNLMQKVGGAATYLRRYLLINAFDIAESDMLDSQTTVDKNNATVDKKQKPQSANNTKPNDSTHALVNKETVDNFINDNQQKLLFATMKDIGGSDSKKACLAYCLKLLVDKKMITYDINNISTKTILKKDFDTVLKQVKAAVEKTLKKQHPGIPEQTI